MRHGVAVLAALWLSLAFAGEDGELAHDHASMAAAASDSAAIQVTINPEARVSASMSGRLPPPGPCGTPTDLRIRIVNQAFVTAALEADLVGNAPPEVAMEFEPAPLTGAREEFRLLRLTLARPGSTDVTIAFRARRHEPDLAGRNRVHFLLRCR